MNSVRINKSLSSSSATSTQRIKSQRTDGASVRFSVADSVVATRANIAMLVPNSAVNQALISAVTAPTVAATPAKPQIPVAPTLDASTIAPLSAASLNGLKAAGVAVPEYDRSAVKQGIVHIGVGAFHSVHQAKYADDFLKLGEDMRWGILGVGMTPSSAKKAAQYASQDFLHTVVETRPEGNKATVVGSMTGFVAASEDPQGLVQKLASAETHIVSLTLTSTGYYYDEATKGLNFEHADIVADLQGNGAPKTMFGPVARALIERRKAGLKPFTVLSCDNLPQNGDLTRKLVVSFLKKLDPATAKWVQAEGGFPNTMVDRITPRPTQEQRDELLSKFGIRDAMAVYTEPFTQFVVEDKFSDGRPSWEKVGVQFTDDVEAFSQAKQRMLNANHSAIAYAGVVAGLKYVHEFMGIKVFNEYVASLMRSEIPVLKTAPGMDLNNYHGELMARFENPALKDEVLRLCRRGSEKVPKFILASVRDRLASDIDIKLSSLIVASFICYLSGVDEGGKEFFVEDPHADKLRALAAESGIDAEAFMRKSGLVGEDLLSNKGFVKEVKRALVSLNVLGAQKTVASYLSLAQKAAA